MFWFNLRNSLIQLKLFELIYNDKYNIHNAYQQMHSPSESNKKSDESRRRSGIYDYFNLKIKRILSLFVSYVKSQYQKEVKCKETLIQQIYGDTMKDAIPKW